MVDIESIHADLNEYLGGERFRAHPPRDPQLICPELREKVKKKVEQTILQMEVTMVVTMEKSMTSSTWL